MDETGSVEFMDHDPFVICHVYKTCILRPNPIQIEPGSLNVLMRGAKSLSFTPSHVLFL